MERCGRRRWRTECLLSGCIGEMRLQDRMGTGRDECFQRAALDLRQKM